MAKTPDVTKQLLEEMASNFHWRDSRAPKRGGKLELDALTMLQSTVQTLAKKVEQMGAGSSSSLKACELCGIEGHEPTEYGAIDKVQVNAIHNARPNFNPYSNT